MIVPKMTHEEVRKEFMHDLQRMKARATNTFNQLLMDLQKRKQQHAVETVVWKSASHNRWMMLFYLDRQQSVCAHVCLTLDHGGFLKTLSATHVEDYDELFISEYNIHFYKRYNERLKLGLTKPEQIVKHFHKHNPRMDTTTELKQIENESKLNLFLPLYNGVGLGFRHDDIRLIEMKTFISNEMLHESQMETVDFLRKYREQDHPPAAPLL